MIIINNINEFKFKNKKIHLALGNFDGVHIGHSKVIKNAEDNKGDGSEVWVLTFNPHPSKVLQIKKNVQMINTQKQQINLFSSIGIDGLIYQPFDKELMNSTPKEFFNNLMQNIPSLSGLYVGDNWSFGKNRSGNTKILSILCKKNGIFFKAQAEVNYENKRISSSRIRHSIREGRMNDAYNMLGRYYSIIGNIIHGEKIGRILGYPTANINPYNECIPANGIYAAICIFKNISYKAALYIGTRKTLHKNNERVIEAHLINTDDINLYDEEIELKVIQFIRTDEKFKTSDELQRQIKKDISIIDKILDKVT
tara:strand:+ start:2134 stop:3066 length:933 start_codon:yes stop_codon:yes gene_type:complete